MMDHYVAALKKYAETSGRATRAEYWYFVLFNILISIGLAILDGIFFSSSSSVLGTLYSLAVLIPSIAVAVRRMHDINRSGWWILLLLVPLLGTLWFIFLAAQDSDPDENMYGPNPKKMMDGQPPTSLS